MKPWQLQALSAVAALLVTSGGIAGYNHFQREIGRREAQIVQLERDRRDARRAADSLAKVFRVDTVRLSRLLRRTDTLTQTVETWKHDTVKVVEFVTRADSTIRACTKALQTCDARVGAERRGREAAEAEVKTLKASMPSSLTPWRHRAEGAVLGLAAWALAGRIK